MLVFLSQTGDICVLLVGLLLLVHANNPLNFRMIHWCWRASRSTEDGELDAFWWSSQVTCSWFMWRLWREEPSCSLFVRKPSLDARSDLKSLEICFENENRCNQFDFAFASQNLKMGSNNCSNLAIKSKCPLDRSVDILIVQHCLPNFMSDLQSFEANGGKIHKMDSASLIFSLKSRLLMIEGESSHKSLQKVPYRSSYKFLFYRKTRRTLPTSRLSSSWPTSPSAASRTPPQLHELAVITLVPQFFSVAFLK